MASNHGLDGWNLRRQRLKSKIRQNNDGANDAVVTCILNVLIKVHIVSTIFYEIKKIKNTYVGIIWF
ncbi:hypothetical protein NQ317_017207 [Molorchus minor]|uniref:Uncharacterized protein n=1 Tax=Molorchus minor TaxID=1323400 RepID=A0ABQ9JVR1_9CUCU|nr:hypothetical protein NQ317_017207 [Molorchus minor]